VTGWLARAGAAAVRRSEEPRNRFARFTAQWLGTTPTVAASRFQDESEPFPQHWRRFPDPWPAVDPADPEVREALAAALDELPATWRAVVIARDAMGQRAEEMSARLGLTGPQQRAILNRARARLRERLAQRLRLEHTA